MARIKVVGGLSAALFLVAILVIAAGVLSSSFNQADNLGLYSGTSWLFYLGIALFLVGIAVRAIRFQRGHISLLCLVLILSLVFAFLGYLVGGPNLATPYPALYAYYFAGVVYTTGAHHIQAAELGAQLSGWPTPLLGFASILDFTGLNQSNDSSVVLPVAHVAFLTFDTLLVYLIAWRFWSDRDKALLSTILYVFGGYFTQAWFQDTAFAYSLFLATVFMLTNMARQRGFNRRSDYVLLALLWFSVCTANFFASLMLLGVVLVYALWAHRPFLGLLYSIILASWLSLGFPPAFSGLYSFALQHLLQIGILLNVFNSAVSQGSPSHHFIVTSQAAYAIVFLLASTLVLIMSRFRNQSTYHLNSTLFRPILAIVGVTLLFGPAFGPNPIESLQRGFIFAFPFFLLIISSMSSRKSLPIVLCLVAVLAPVNVLTTFGPAVTTYSSTAEESASFFVSQHTQSSVSILELEPGYYGTGYYPLYFTTSLNPSLQSIFLNSSQLQKLVQLGGSGSYVVAGIGRQVSVGFTAIGSSRDYETVVNTLLKGSDLVYANPDQQQLFVQLVG